MKIGFFDPYLGTLGGGEKYMLTAALCLSENKNVSFFWDLEDIDSIKKKAKERFNFDLSKISFVENIFSSKTSIATRIAKAKEYDAIVYLSNGSIPLVLTRNLIIHFQFPVEWTSGNSLKTKLKLLQVKKVICNSEFTKLYIDKKFGIKSQVIYPPVSNVGMLGKKENIILNVGRFGMDIEGSTYKKQEVMIEAFKKMDKKDLNNWKFILIISVSQKDLPRMEGLKKMAKGFAIDIIENPDNNTLWELYRKAKIYWHASGFGENLQTNPEKAEHFGIATAEAMTTGAVPVVINAGGQKEIVKNGENGFLWKTIDDLIKKTKMLIQDNVLLEKLSKEALKQAGVFSKEHFCKQINFIIK